MPRRPRPLHHRLQLSITPPPTDERDDELALIRALTAVSSALELEPHDALAAARAAWRNRDRAALAALGPTLLRAQVLLLQREQTTCVAVAAATLCAPGLPWPHGALRLLTSERIIAAAALAGLPVETLELMSTTSAPSTLRPELLTLAPRPTTRDLAVVSRVARAVKYPAYHHHHFAAFAACRPGATRHERHVLARTEPIRTLALEDAGDELDAALATLYLEVMTPADVRRVLGEAAALRPPPDLHALALAELGQVSAYVQQHASTSSQLALRLSCAAHLALPPGRRAWLEAIAPALRACDPARPITDRLHLAALAGLSQLVRAQGLEDCVALALAQLPLSLHERATLLGALDTLGPRRWPVARHLAHGSEAILDHVILDERVTLLAVHLLARREIHAIGPRALAALRELAQRTPPSATADTVNEQERT